MMATSRHSTLRAAPAVLTLWAALAASAVTAATPAGLDLTITMEKQEYAPLEPVVVGYTIRNGASNSVEIPQGIEPSRGYVVFEVTDAQGVFHPYRTGIIACGTLTKTSLGSGAALVGELRMVSNQHAGILAVDDAPGVRGAVFPFAEPGSYSVRARFAVDGSFGDAQARILDSNVLTIVVREAKAQEREALTFLPSYRALAVALGGDAVAENGAQHIQESGQETVARWEDFVDHFGSTVYAPFVRLTLASFYVAQGALPTVRPDLAAGHLRIVAKSGPRSIRDDALLELAKAELAGGRSRQAGDAVAELMRSYPQSEHAKEARRISDGLRAGRRTLHDILGE